MIDTGLIPLKKYKKQNCRRIVKEIVEDNPDGKYINLQTKIKTISKVHYTPLQENFAHLWIEANDGQNELLISIEKKRNQPFSHKIQQFIQNLHLTGEEYNIWTNPNNGIEVFEFKPSMFHHFEGLWVREKSDRTFTSIHSEKRDQITVVTPNLILDKKPACPYHKPFLGKFMQP